MRHVKCKAVIQAYDDNLWSKFKILKNLRSFSVVSGTRSRIHSHHYIYTQAYRESFYFSEVFHCILRTHLLGWHFKCTRHKMTCLCGVMLVVVCGSAYFIMSLADSRSRSTQENTNNRQIQRDKMCITCVCKMPFGFGCACSTLIIEERTFFLLQFSIYFSSEQII